MKSNPALDGLPLRSVYGIDELAAAAGINRRRLHRHLLRGGVRLLILGRRVLVPLTEIRRRIPPLWKSIVLAERVRRRVKVTSGE